MGWQFDAKPFGRTILAACAFAWLAPPALAAEASYCVTCRNPDQAYRCRVTSDGPTAADTLKLYCIIRTAQEGKHSSCSAERKTEGCGGAEKVYTFDGAAISSQIASDPRARNVIQQVQREQDAFAKPKGNAPKTVVELGGRAVSASRQSWQNARARLGGGSTAASQPTPSPSAAPPPQAAPLPQSEPAATQASVQAEPQAAVASAAPPSESRMKRASNAVGGFARKSYRCVRSLFRRCSDETVQ
jgi:hypothetical protein